MASKISLRKAWESEKVIGMFADVCLVPCHFHCGWG